jgi:hypothetical protein
MNIKIRQNFPPLLLVFVLGLASLACSLSPQLSPSPTTNPTAASVPTQIENKSQPGVSQGSDAAPTSPTLPPTESSSPTAAVNDDTALLLQPDPLDNLLSLTSIQFDLVVQRPDGAARTIHGQIDPAGNMAIKFTDPQYDISGMPAGFKALPTAPETEIYVLDGKAYQPDKIDPAWKNTPVAEDFKAAFSLELHGMEGPALWLNLLPAGSVTPDGSEEVGGFNAARYQVAGEISGQKVYGTIWKEPQSNALIQAELHIPAGLLSSPDTPASGEMRITLKAQKAEIKPIVLPE